MIDDPELVHEFIVESQEHLANVESQLLSLEMNFDEVDVGLVNKVFRGIHSIKGAAGFLGFDAIETLAHREEEVLNRLRNQELKPSSHVINTLLRATDRLKTLMDAIESSNEQDVSGQVAALESLLQSETQPAPSQDELDLRHITEANHAVSPHSSKSVPTATTLFVDHPDKVTQSTSVVEANYSNASEPNANAATDSTIRVDVALLDKLMTRVGELVLARNQILQFTSVLENAELLSTCQRLNLITTELQEGVMKTRMQPIGNVWSKFPRLVRDLAAMCNKQVRIEMEGKDTELDKTIIEAIKDPLTHLVRNTVDHGIEKSEIRVAAGKPAEGCLSLRAFHEGGQVNIEICDDGAGLNLERIKNRAIDKGLISAEYAARLSDSESAQLIFLPGLSTADKVSNVSGRGVGMDVVKTNIEKIGGTVDLQTRSGHGTTIRIKIPLTLAIIPALVVTNDRNRFAIPQVNLLELVRLEGESAQSSIEWIHGSPVYRLRGRLLPLVYLRKVLKPKSEAIPSSDVINIVILRADDRQFGLVVDRINDTEEIVVKPLSKQLKNTSIYSGATIMGDGKVALILDVLGLAYASNVVSKVREHSRNEIQSRDKDNADQPQTLLILGTETDKRLALPISQVARLETISKDTIEFADRREVVQYRGNILPLIRLANVLGGPTPDPNSDLLNVVVYHENDRSIGLVVDRIVDIVETPIEIHHPSSRSGLLGSTVIDQRVTDLVDLPAIIRQSDQRRADIDPALYQGMPS